MPAGMASLLYGIGLGVELCLSSRRQVRAGVESDGEGRLAGPTRQDPSPTA
jgi:hypothetical protein